MHSRFTPGPQLDAGNIALGTKCTPCRKHNFDCDRVRAVCGECIRNGTICHYADVNTVLAEQTRDPLQMREIETRLKKIETQFLADSAADGSNAGDSKERLQGKLIGGKTGLVKRSPKFSIGPGGGLCIETNITEVHHFVKILFNAIDVEKIVQRAHATFDIVMPIPTNAGAIPELTSELMPQLLSMDDQVEEAWLDMVVTSRHHRCLIIYQMVGRERVSWPTSYLRQLAAENRTQELLLAMSMRAYIYQHENELHQDSEFSFRTPKGYDYVQCAKVLLDECFLDSSRITIRALLHLFFFHIHHHPEESFQYSDLAIRMAQDLELHKKSHGRDDEDDRRLWWAVYWCHMFTVALFDRPFMMMDEDIKIDFPCKLPEEEADVGYCIDYCIMSIKLLRIHRTIAQSLRKRWEIGQLLEHVRLIEKELDAWQRSLPVHARVDINRHEHDNLCIELGMMLTSHLQGTKIQLYQCFLENSQPLSLVAIQSCKKALRSITDMLILYGSQMRMCGCIRMLPTLRQCVALLAASAQSSESLDEFRLLHSVLTSHSFSFLKETRAIADLIDATLKKISRKNSGVSASAASNSENSGSATIITTSTPDGEIRGGSITSSELSVDLSPSKVHPARQHTVNQPPAGRDPYLTRVPMTTTGALLPTSSNQTVPFPGHEMIDLNALAQGSSEGGSIGNRPNVKNNANSHAGRSQWSAIHQKYMMLEQQSIHDAVSSRSVGLNPRQEWSASSSSIVNIAGLTAVEAGLRRPSISSDMIPSGPGENNVTVPSEPDACLQSWTEMVGLIGHGDITMMESSIAGNPVSQCSVSVVGENGLLKEESQQRNIYEPAPVQQWSTDVETICSTNSLQQDYRQQQWPSAMTGNPIASNIHLNMAYGQPEARHAFPSAPSRVSVGDRNQQHQGLLQQFPIADPSISGLSLRSSKSVTSRSTLSPSTAAAIASTSSPQTSWPAVGPSSDRMTATDRSDIQQHQFQQQEPSSNLLLPLASSFEFVQWPISDLGQPQQQNDSSTYQQHMYSQQFSFNSHAP